MRFTFLLLILNSLLAISPAHGQRKTKLDTVAAFRAFNEGQRLRKVAKYDSAILAYQLAAASYKAYALSLPQKHQWAAPKQRAWERHIKANSYIAQCLFESGSKDSAIQKLAQVIDKSHERLGTSSIVHGEILNLMGYLWLKQSNLSVALNYFRQSLNVFQNALGEMHPNVAMGYSNIGSIYRDQTKYDSSMIYYQKALAIRKQAFGEQHVDVATSYYSIGLVHSDVGDYDQALTNIHQALSIAQSILGDQHPDVALYYGNIGTVYYEQGRYEQSFIYQQQELNILKQAYGEIHYMVARNYNNMGSLCRAQGQLAQALNYFQRSVAIKKQIFGEQHISLAYS